MSGRGGGRGAGRGVGRGVGRGRGRGSYTRQQSGQGQPGPPEGATASASESPHQPGQGQGTSKRSRRRNRQQSLAQQDTQRPPVVEGPLATPYKPHPQAKQAPPAESIPSHPQPGITPPERQPQATPPAESRPQASQPKTKGSKAKSSAKLSSGGRKQPPDRPGYGTLGRKMVVRANFFPVNFPRYITVIHYDVTFLPEGRYPKWLLRLFVAELERKFGKEAFGGKKIAFDGAKNIYTSQAINMRGGDRLELKVELTHEEQTREVSLVIKHARTMNIDMNKVEELMKDLNESTPFIQAIDVIMGHLPSLKHQHIGRSFFSKPARPTNLSGGVELWEGYYQSLRPTMGWKFMLNFDTSATGFYTEQPVIDFMVTILKGGFGRDAVASLTPEDRARYTHQQLDNRDRISFEAAIKKLKIQVTHLPYPRKYTVVGVTRSSAKDQTFDLDGRKCSVADYFKTQYKIVLRYPHLPCLHCGDPKKNIYIPVEVCKIVENQRCSRKLNEIQTSNMIRAITRPAYDREKIIKEKFREANHQADPLLKEFGIGVRNEMAQIPARVLDPPSLGYADRASMRPPRDRGAWDIRGKKFFQAAVVEGYAVLVLSTRVRDHEISKFLDLLVKCGVEKGMEFKGRPIIKKVVPRDSLEKIFRELKSQVNLIIAIIDNPRRGEPSKYNEIKRIGDTTAAGIATQCVKSDTITRKCNPQTCTNICLKINPKLGAINNTVDKVSMPRLFQQEPVIVFGADVTHPRAGDITSPSIAAVVATTDPSATIFKGKHHVQEHRKEIITDLKNLAKELLKDFRRKCGHKPTRIIFYRDGVSEGQFETVRVEEIGALQRACLELEPSGEYQPGITFLVVQKRHHTRLFPVDRKDADRTGNVPPGTIVERDITHPNEFDFYLCSHAAIQGTSRPCHYHIIWDDNDFTPDELQTLSYQLCHIFWRCTRSVSYPSPAYYAHRVAAHAKVLLQANQDRSAGGKDPGIAEMDRLIKIHEDRSGFMYFM